MKPVVNVTVGGQKKPSNYTYKTVVLKSNLPFGSQVGEPNCIYVIKWDYDLGGETVTIPENCVLEFDGGSLRNGTIVLNNTIIASEHKCFEDITLQGTIGNDDAHVKWFGSDVSMADLQMFFDFALDAKKNVNFDGLSVVINKKIELNNLVLHKDWWWWTIKNGTIICDADNTEVLFTADNSEAGSHYTGYPSFGCIIFDGIQFVNSSVDPNISPREYEYYKSIYGGWLNDFDWKEGGNAEWVAEHPYSPITTKTRVIDDSRFSRMTFNNCTFNGVSLVEEHKIVPDTNKPYFLQSYYISGCKLYNMEYTFIEADKGYDIRFTENAIEEAYEATLIDIGEPVHLEVSSNLIQFIKNAVKFIGGLSVAVTNNYFEGCRAHVVEQYGRAGNTGFIFTGNSCIQSRQDIVSDGGEGEYDYLHFNAWMNGYSIQGNNFFVQSFASDRGAPRPDYTVKPVKFINKESYGIFLGGLENEYIDTDLGNMTTKVVIRNISGDPNKSILEAGSNGSIAPIGGLSDDMGVDGDYDSRIPAIGGAHRITIDQEKVRYTLKKRDNTNINLYDQVWEARLMDAKASYIPWTYVKRQLAEDYLAAVNGDIDPHTPKGEAILQSPWIRQCMMLDMQAGQDYLDTDLGQPESRMDFTQVKNYYDGLMRFNPSDGLQWWKSNGWYDALGFKGNTKRYGGTEDRPFVDLTVVDSFTEGNYVITSDGRYVSTDGTYKSTLVDVSAFRNGLVVLDTNLCYVSFLKSAPTVGNKVEFASGYNYVSKCEDAPGYWIPDDAAYLYIVLKAEESTYTVNGVSLTKDFVPYKHFIGFKYFDTDINKPIWFSGDLSVGDNGWVDANGENPYPSDEPNNEE